MTKLVIAIALLIAFGGNADCADSLAVGKTKSTGTALTQSIIGTLIPIGGQIFGPGLGHLYAGNKDQFYTGSFVRAFAFGACIAGYGLATSNSESYTTVMLAATGLFVWFGATIYDIATVPRAVREYNEAHSTGYLSVAPLYLPDERAPGVAVVLRF